VASLLLIRHGQASYGQADYDRLSPIGERQARAVGAHLARGKLEGSIDMLFVGPLRRQQQTAALARDGAGTTLPTPTTLDELAEYPAFEILKRLGPRLVRDEPRFADLFTAPTPALMDEAFHYILGRWARGAWTDDGVERVEDFIARVRRGLDRMFRAAASGARIAAVTSAGPIGVAVGLVFGASHERMVRASTVIRNASITELVFRTRDFAWRDDQLSVMSLNLTAHLPDDLQTER
jgi:broad specificity phosphatase PhoE